MTYDLLLHLGEQLAALLTSWQFVLGALVLSVGPALVLRRRRRTPTGASSSDDQAATRGHRLEDCLTMLVAAAAAALSATGLRKVGHDQMGLEPPWDLLPFLALDIAAMVCGRRARHRAGEGEGPGLSGILFWILAGTSSLFSAAEAPTAMGSAVRAVWPVLAAVLWELGSLEERRAARTRRERPDRRLALIRLFRPAESLRVAMLLAAHRDLNQNEATEEVRISRAAYRWYRLRRAQEATKKAGRPMRWAYRMREARAEARAQNASERAGCADLAVLAQVVSRLQLRVRQTEWAGMNLRSSTAFDSIRTTLIGTAPATAAHTGTPHTGPPAIPYGTANLQVEGGMANSEGQNGDEDRHADEPASPAEGSVQHRNAPSEVLTDEQVKEAFVRLIPRRDGRLAWGINKCATTIGIGTPRARKFHQSQDEWLPAALAQYEGQKQANQTFTAQSHKVDIKRPEATASADPGPAPELSPLRAPAIPADLLEMTGAGPFRSLPGTGLLVPAVNGTKRT